MPKKKEFVHPTKIIITRDPSSTAVIEATGSHPVEIVKKRLKKR